MESAEYMELKFNDIVNQYYPSLCYFAERTVGERFPAEEIVQDVFVKFWKAMDNFEHPAAIKKFLYLSVRNASLNYLRDRKVRLERQAEASRLTDTEEADITRNLVEAEVWREITLALQSLPEQCGRIIRMSFEEGLSSTEIARQMGISASTVRNQKARGVALLRNLLSRKAFGVLMLFL